MRVDDSTLETAPRGQPGARNRRQLLLLLLFTGFLALIATGILLGSAPSGALRRAAATGMDDDLTTGSIVFVPILGERCRNRLIDNTTWRIRDNGEVDCRTALSQHSNAPRLQWSSPRIDVIRQGFARR